MKDDYKTILTNTMINLNTAIAEQGDDIVELKNWLWWIQIQIIILAVFVLGALIS